MASHGAAAPEGISAPVREDVVTAAVATGFARILGIQEPAITADSDFFLLGGSSILAAQLVAELRQELPVKVTIRDLFRARTAGALTEVLRLRAQS